VQRLPEGSSALDNRLEHPAPTRTRWGSREISHLAACGGLTCPGQRNFVGGFAW